MITRDEPKEAARRVIEHALITATESTERESVIRALIEDSDAFDRALADLKSEQKVEDIGGGWLLHFQHRLVINAQSDRVRSTSTGQVDTFRECHGAHWTDF